MRLEWLRDAVGYGQEYSTPAPHETRIMNAVHLVEQMLDDKDDEIAGLQKDLDTERVRVRHYQDTLVLPPVKFVALEGHGAAYGTTVAAEAISPKRIYDILSANDRLWEAIKRWSIAVKTTPLKPTPEQETECFQAARDLHEIAREVK